MFCFSLFRNQILNRVKKIMRFCVCSWKPCSTLCACFGEKCAEKRNKMEIILGFPLKHRMCEATQKLSISLTEVVKRNVFFTKRDKECMALQKNVQQRIIVQKKHIFERVIFVKPFFRKKGRTKNSHYNIKNDIKMCC